MNGAKWLAGALLIAVLPGCALTVDRIDLQYTPQPDARTIPGASNVALRVTALDQRQDKTKVGSKKNGYGMEMAAIVVNEDASLTIRRAIEQELRARGFTLTPTASVNVVAEVTRFNNDFKMGFFAGDAVADLYMGVSVRNASDQILYSRQVLAQGLESSIQLASGDNAKLALERALGNAIKTLFDDHAFLAALLGKSTTGGQASERTVPH